ncbi:MAG: hypothetical protein IPQ06_13190 [Chitinophagaceae bacterium]|nr:hypothetical protein [Chitinophagaceae bacterium]MBK9570537.1 hypothetical protein [Chitinophagaceae bacterium]MBL0273991.1 hypothetical protein [Chitinophagaceae bacterium]
MTQLAIMNIEKGEEIAIAVVSGSIPGTGRYKFFAKKKKNGQYEWAHFTERESGLKEKVFRGEVKNEEELKLVLEIMNRNLKRIFGDVAEMKQGIPEFRSMLGTKFDDSIN